MVSDNLILKNINEYVNQKDINSLIVEFKKEIRKQNTQLFNVLQFFDSVTAQNILKQIHEERVIGLFVHNDIIIERYSNNFNTDLILESKFNIKKEILKMEKFLFDSLLTDTDILSEQWWKDWANKAVEFGKSAAKAIAAPYVAAYQGAKTAVNYVSDKLKSAVNYIKENGIGFIMESIRKALTSGVGTAIQVALAFTGVGNVVNWIVWGVMALYDGYQYFVNNAQGSLMNLIIDVLCLATSGTLGKVLGKFFGKATGKLGDVIKFLVKNAGSALKSVFSVISKGASTIGSWLGQAAKFMSEKMGIKWAGTVVGKISEFFKGLVKNLDDALKTGYDFAKKNIRQGKSNIIKGGIGIGQALTDWVLTPSVTKHLTPLLQKTGRFFGKDIFKFLKFDQAAIKALQEVTDDQIIKWTGKNLGKAKVKAIVKETEKLFRDDKILDALSYVDKQYGTDMADLFSLRLYGQKYQNALGKKWGAIDFGTDWLRARTGNPEEAKYGVSKNLASATATVTQDIANVAGI